MRMKLKRGGDILFSNYEIVSIALTGLLFSNLFFFMIFMQKNNAKKNIIDNRTYMLSWVSALPSLISCILLFRHAMIKNSYIIGMVAVICILLTIVLYLVFSRYDTKSLKGWYSDDTKYNGVPKYFLFITALISAMTVSVIFGWIVLVFGEVGF